MTHGDKEKAKAAKSNKASVKKAGENGKGKAVQTIQAGKSVSKTVPENKGSSKTGKAAEKSSGKARQTAGEKAKDAGIRPDLKAQSNSTPADANNPVVAAAERAIQKYPNAFRKLTD